ncbi:hypothetical protein NE659_26990, partial [Flavonifractor plautii]|uniref:transketolase C-terminal domain-containing protein n=1 Tax=Flavonifractor plautii TaxID=292800 RepID=UPI0027314E34
AVSNPPYFKAGSGGCGGPARMEGDCALEDWCAAAGRLLIVDEGHLSFGITGEIASRIMPDVFYDLDAPIQRMGTADVPLPFSPALETAREKPPAGRVLHTA